MTQTAPTSVVNALADRFWEGILHLNPTLATVYGDERYDDRLPDPGPAGRAAGRELCTTTLRAAEAIPETGLSVEERITRDMLTVACELRLTELDQRALMRPLSKWNAVIDRSADLPRAFRAVRALAALAPHKYSTNAHTLHFSTF